MRSGPMSRGAGLQLDSVISPFILYAMIALGGVGVLLALPRERVSLALPGYILGTIAGGVVLLLLFFASQDPDPAAFAGPEGPESPLGVIPNPYFYAFAILGLAAAMRVITHPKPVYSALYFILTILATSGLFLILSAEFMAFALIIIYAGAILITYLFVIMLATQSQSEELVEQQPAYDRLAREPVAATAAGFVLLAALSTMLGRGVPVLTMDESAFEGDQLLAQLPTRIERSLREEYTLDEGVGIRTTERIAREITATGPDGPFLVDPMARTVVVEVVNDVGDGARRTVAWPADLAITNPEGVGWELIKAHPGAIEIAGVILLMAMLGATVLARKQIQLDEDAKRDMAMARSGKSDDTSWAGGSEEETD
ncbi:MAG: NADH-quinone oxidoreductase subunit J [Planctomycetota bacterium]